MVQKSMAGLPPAIVQVLNQDALAPLLAKARWNEKLLTRVRQVLPEPLGAHCLYCLPRHGGRLVLYADNAAWAARLRFYQTEVKAALQELLGPIAAVHVRVLLPQGKVEKPPPRIKTPPPEVLDGLERAANALEDPELKRCVQRLARALRRA
ncbi:DciA family protein [Methylothermus subterraneus]